MFKKLCSVRYTGIELLVLDMNLITIKPTAQDYRAV